MHFFCHLGVADLGKMGTEQIRMCPYCNFSSVSEARIQAHIATQHAQQPKLRCPLCQENFVEKMHLEKHLINVHNVNREGMQRLLPMVEQPDCFGSATPSSGQKSGSNTPASTPTPNEEGNCSSEGPKAEILESDAIRIGEDGTCPIMPYLTFKITLEVECSTGHRLMQKLRTAASHVAA